MSLSQLHAAQVKAAKLSQELHANNHPSAPLAFKLYEETKAVYDAAYKAACHSDQKAHSEAVSDAQTQAYNQRSLDIQVPVTGP